MTGSHQRDKSAEAFWRQLSLKEVHQSSCLFVFIAETSSLTNGCFPSRVIRPVAGGGRARRQTGVAQRGQAGFQRSRPPDTPHLTIGTTPPGARACPHAVRLQFPCDIAADRPAGGNRMGRPKQRQGTAAG